MSLSWIHTSSGRAFSMVNPSPADVSLVDIGRALSRINRFTGHSKTGAVVNVAAHSLNVAIEVGVRGRALGLPQSDLPALQAVAHFHDASEAYIGDISSPLKQAAREAGFNFLDVLGEKVDRAIAEATGIDAVTLGVAGYLRLIKDADLAMLRYEAETRLHGCSDWGWDPPIRVADNGRLIANLDLSSAAAADLWIAMAVDYVGTFDSLKLCGKDLACSAKWTRRLP